jgi:hypothetical protein
MVDNGVNWLVDSCQYDTIDSSAVLKITTCCIISNGDLNRKQSPMSLASRTYRNQFMGIVWFDNL